MAYNRYNLSKNELKKLRLARLTDNEKVRHALRRREVSIGQIGERETVQTVQRFFRIHYHYPPNRVRVYINDKYVFVNLI